MKKEQTINKRKYKEHITNLMLLTTVEVICVFIALFVIYRASVDINTVLVTPWVVLGLFVLSIISAVFFGYTTFIKKKDQIMHFIFSVFLIVLFAILVYGFNSPYFKLSLLIACIATGVYVIGMFVVYFIRLNKKKK